MRANTKKRKKATVMLKATQEQELVGGSSGAGDAARQASTGTIGKPHEYFDLTAMRLFAFPPTAMRVFSMRCERRASPPSSWRSATSSMRSYVCTERGVSARAGPRLKSSV